MAVETLALDRDEQAAVANVPRVGAAAHVAEVMTVEDGVEDTGGFFERET
jgi:hypothetical protein